MSLRRDLERRLAGLRDIRSIMSSMRALAVMETRKLDRLLQSQRALVATIDSAALDLLQHNPGLRPQRKPGRVLSLLIGSERGFCGDFNESLLQSHSPAASPQWQDWIMVGHKLRMRAGDHARVRVALDGANVAEDVDRVLAQIVDVINLAEHDEGGPAVIARYHGAEGSRLAERTLLPPWMDAPAGRRAHPLPPILNIDAPGMLRKLVEHYLYAVLHEILLASLWAENLRRARHLDGAVNRLDKRIEQMRSRSQQLRQEEIVEEIEVILLNGAGPQYKVVSGWTQPAFAPKAEVETVSSAGRDPG